MTSPSSPPLDVAHLFGSNYIFASIRAGVKPGEVRLVATQDGAIEVHSIQSGGQSRPIGRAIHASTHDAIIRNISWLPVQVTATFTTRARFQCDILVEYYPKGGVHPANALEVLEGLLGGESIASLKATTRSLLARKPPVFDDAVSLNIASFLTAPDMMSLGAVDRRWRDFLSMHEESLFRWYLEQDFAEGAVLAYVARERQLSCERLYRAFFSRYRLPMGEKRVIARWRRPVDCQLDRPIQENADVKTLVFIARLGSNDDKNSCALMEWNRNRRIWDDWDHEGKQQLVIDKGWSEAVGGYVLPQLPPPDGEYDRDNDNAMLELANQSHRLTFHVLDVERCHVMTMMDEYGYTCYLGGGSDGCFLTRHPSMMYGLPPKTSPYFKAFTEKEYEEIDKFFQANLPLGWDEPDVMQGRYVEYLLLDVR